jgi:hypothetical protein
LRCNNGDYNGNSEFEDKIEACKNMSCFWGKFISTDGDEEDEAEDEGQGCSDDDKCCGLVEVTILIIGEGSRMYSLEIRILIVVDMSCSSDLMNVLLPAK